MADFYVPARGESFNAKEVLSKFLVATQDQLREALEAPTYLILLRFQPYAQDAYRDVPSEFEKMHTALKDVDDDVLVAHGLTGASLLFKLALIRDAEQRFSSSRTPRAGRGLFKRILVCIDIPLESLVDALGVGGLVVEFKKTIEQAIPRNLLEI